MIQPVLPVCEVVDDTVLTTSSTQLNLFRALYDAKENENKELKEENDILKLEIIALKSQVGVVVDIAASSTSWACIVSLWEYTIYRSEDNNDLIV